MYFFTKKGLYTFLTSKKALLTTPSSRGFVVKHLLDHFIIDDVNPSPEVYRTEIETYIDTLCQKIVNGDTVEIPDDKPYCLAYTTHSLKYLENIRKAEIGVEDIYVIYDELQRFKPGTALSTSTVVSITIKTIKGIDYTVIETANTNYILAKLP